MKNTLTMTPSVAARRSVAVLMAGLLGLSLAACSVGDKTEDDGGSPSASESAADDTASDDTTSDDAAASGDFCDAFESFTNVSSELGASDPAAAVASLQEAVDAMKAADAPAEIADDWNTMESTLSDYTAVLQAIVDDPTDAEAMTKLQDGISTLTSTEMTAAAEKVGSYVGTNC